MATNVELARMLYDSWNERDFDRSADAMAPDGRIEIVGTGDVFDGPDGVRKFDEMWANGFPDGQVTIDNLVESGDCVVVEYTGRGTHTGPLVTSMGSFPATGRSLTLKLCDVVEIENGKVKRQRSYFDSGSMMAQLGIAPQHEAISAE